MDQQIQKPEGASEHIWLRYGTQFTANGRTYTLEMSIPMPIGASAELRELLLNEADAGMNQLASHVENRMAQMLQQAQSMQEAIPTPTPTALPAVTPQRPAKPAPEPTATPVPQAAAQEAAQPPTTAHVVRETAPGPLTREVTVPPTRTTVGASMPPAATMGAASGNLTIPEFIKLINDSMGLNPKQAMEMLNVRSLSGLNLRDALERLQRMGPQQTASANRPPVGTDVSRPPDVSRPRTGETAAGRDTPVPTAGVTPSSRPAPVSGPPPAPTNSAAQSVTNETAHKNESMIETVREEHPVYIFDEEINPDEEEEQDGELEDLDESRELSPLERVRAKTRINRLRESRGATFANAARQQALDNVIGDQISREQLQELVTGIWSVSSLKKLKVDQVEALISWAKEDEFVNEVEMVLAVLEEENYARDNR